MKKRKIVNVVVRSIFLLSLFNAINAHAQCNGSISTFPYVQDFEADNGGWIVNGTQPSWQWGNPAKPVINSAASGNKCWVTGGLTNGFYNNGEASWLQSPCFDFTNYPFPYLSVKIWWETERGFDGAGLQYSTDNGSTWNDVGFAGDTKNCLDSNWFNASSIRFLSQFGSNGSGWCGSTKSGGGNCGSGDGSAGWVTAKHLLNGLGGKPNVIFRFIFGAGTQCNNYDGFALDDFSIVNAPIFNGNISFNCLDSNTATFKFNTKFCPTEFNWDFGDPASGNSNTSTNAVPQHTFSAPGNYTVTARINGLGTSIFTTTQLITIFKASAGITIPIACNGGATGAATAIAIGNSGPFTYIWSTIPAQNTAIATGLIAATYTVAVAAQNSCPVNASVTLTNTAISVSASLQQPGCRFANGSIQLAVSGGVKPYSYTWLPAISNGDLADALLPGNYVVTVKDARQCSITNQYSIATLPKPTFTIFKLTDMDCNGRKMGSAAVIVRGGTAPFAYVWDINPLLVKDTVTGLMEGNHSVAITDSNGCSTSGNVNIGISGVCNEVYFPNAFSPNGDRNNDFFGPIGNVLAVSNYFLAIYNRFGQIIFSTNNPLIKWDGTYNGKKLDTGTYIFQASYTYNGRIKKRKHGSLIIIR